MNLLKRIYLDNAATSWPKPEAVYAAVDKYQREVGAAAGRGTYASAQQAERVVDKARRASARLLGVDKASQIALASNGTDALNLAIHGILRPGDHVVTTVCEHNSVLRPLAAQAARNDVTVSYVNCDSAGFVSPEEVRRQMRPNTRLVVVSHASNVTGAIQPIREIAEVAHSREALLLVDAAQTAGAVPIDIEQLGADLLASGGHKSLLGPLGTGVLYVRPGIEQYLLPSRQGGTGTDSRTAAQPDQMPQKLESGNPNVPALAGLTAGIEFLLERSVESQHAHLAKRTQQLLDGLASISGVTVFGPQESASRVAVVSFSADGYDPQELTAALDASCGIECRAGLHCAPRMHAALGTLDQGGLIRVSPGWSTTEAEIHQALVTFDQLVRAAN